jgi:hypothetical protein
VADMGWTKLPAGVWGRVSPRALATYAYLLHRARREDMVAFPGKDTIAADTCQSESSVTRALGELVEVGWIVPLGRSKGRKPTRYKCELT